MSEIPKGLLAMSFESKSGLVEIDPALKALAGHYAAERGISLSELVRVAVAAHIGAPTTPLLSREQEAKRA